MNGFLNGAVEAQIVERRLVNRLDNELERMQKEVVLA
jgi:hypothetical protein